MQMFAAEMGVSPSGYKDEALTTLSGHDYPGNVRELKNVVERAMIESGGNRIAAEHLDTANGNVTRAARLLGIDRNKVYRIQAKARG